MRKKSFHYFICWNIFLLLLNTFSFSAQVTKDSLCTQVEVQLDSGINTIYGTLTVPPIIGKMPVVLIIPGSGPTDRDGNNPFGLSTDCYKMLARGLAEKGIASLRYDKRGVGKSSSSLVSEKNLTIAVYVNDAENWVKLLRKDPRFSKIIVLGHSEGALIGTLTANFQRTNAFISVSGAGLRADSLIINQIYKQSPALADTARQIINHIKKEEVFYVNKDLEALFRPSVVSYLNSWFELSPVVEISILRCPVLIIQGSNDIQVSVDEANELAKAKAGSKLVIIENMNHILKVSPKGLNENMATYRDSNLPLAPELMPAITEFIYNIK